MSDLTFGSYFSGGGLVDVGAVQAGFTAVFAVEGDPGNWEQSMRIADAYEANIGAHVIRAAVQDVDPAELPAVDWFHASPVCKNASVANQKAGEKDVDIITAQATAAYIAEHRPRFVTIENVWGYRKFEAWHLIARELTAQGYQFRVDHINMADYGVPQTRQRMWVTAVLNGNRLGLLPPTHQKDPVPSLFGAGLPRWVSWYEAIEDLIPTLPLAYKRVGEPCPHDPHGRECRESEYCPGHFADWQMDRLPEEFQELLGGTNGNSFAVLWVCGNGHQWYATNKMGDCPVCGNDDIGTVLNENDGLAATVLVHGTNANGLTVNQNNSPSAVVVASLHTKAAMPKAFIAAQGSYGDDMPVCFDGSPAQTVTANSNQASLKAFVVNESSSMEVREAYAPAATQVASQRNDHQRAFTHGRVVKLTPRAIARIQTMPDWYTLPDNDRDAVALLGNGVPTRFAYVNGVRFCELAKDG